MVAAASPGFCATDGSAAGGRYARRVRAHATLVLCALGWACAPSADAPVRFEVPRPALADVDESVRQQLEERAREVETLLVSGEVTASEAAAAIGRLGRHYHAYDLTTDAEICYREALRLEPGPEWSYYLGFLDQVRGELESAAESYRRVLALAPADAPARLRLADVLAQLGRAEEAERLYSELIESGPAAAAHRGLARLAAEAGRHREAIDHLESALESQPEATALHHPLAQAFRALGDEEGAMRHLERAGTGQVTFADPRVTALDRLAVGAGVRLARGGVALAEGRLEVALAEYREAVAADPENPAARTNLALVLASQGERVEAREQLREALRLEPSNLQAGLSLANLLAADGELESAVEAFDRTLAEHPDHPGARRGRAAALMALGDGARALADLRAVVDDTPQDGVARLRLGSVLQETGDQEGAERQYRAALELDLGPTELAAAHLSLGNLSAERQALDAALGHYDAALELHPDLSQAIYNRAGVLARLGHYAEAAAAYRRLLELEPGPGAARFYLGDALLSSGQPAEAVAVFEAVGEGDPHYERARLGVAVGLKRMGRRAEALASLEESVEALPRDGPLAHELALTLASSADHSLRDGDRAVDLASRLFAQQPSPMHAETLAMALAEAGRFAQAIELQGRLVSEAATSGNDALVARLRAVLELYEGGEACCPPPS